MRARFINEMALSNIHVTDIVNSKLVDKWLNDSYIEEMFLQYYGHENNLDRDDIEDMDEETSNDFKEWMLFEIRNLCEDVIYKFERLISQNKTISIWRDMIVDENWLSHIKTQGKRLGVYWSWEEDAAEAHWGYNIKDRKIKVKIESKIGVEYIDWYETIELNTHPSYEEEKEIRLFKNTPLRIVSLEVDNKQIDISNIKNKIFKA